MTLQQTAFMIDLIRSSHRRRVLYFFLNIFVLIAPLLPGIYFSYSNNESTVAAIIMISAVIRLMARRLPWSIKKEQVKALSQKESASFSDLRNSPCLHEYFFI